MEVERPNQSISPDELKDLEKLKALIERATADGKLTQAEIETVKVALRADGQITPQELELVQQLIYDKLQSGELEMGW
jgi:uncharacterized tellurite resistance protein B-like protein